jgi:hypothetical protein
MSALVTPRRGKAVSRVAVEHYGAFHAAEYRGMRDIWLLVARSTTSHELRADRIRNAINAHRSMMRCLREVARERSLEAA